MALKIRSAADPIKVENISVVIYSPPGLGKTTLAFSTHEPLLFDFDKGAHRASNRQDSVDCSRWSDVAGVTLDDLAPYGTVIVDTAGRALDALTVDIISRDAKTGYGGALSQQGWGRLKAEFVGWMKLVRQAGKDVVLITHMSEKMQGDETIERIDVQGGSKDEIYKSADAMCRLVIRGGKRLLIFDPTETAYGKNPGKLPVIEVPDPLPPTFFGDLIDRIKIALNAESDAQRERAALIASWQGRIAGCKDATSFNALLPAIKAEPRPIQKLLADAAKAAGLVFDKEAGHYAPAPAETDAELLEKADQKHEAEVTLPREEADAAASSQEAAGEAAGNLAAAGGTEPEATAAPRRGRKAAQ